MGLVTILIYLTIVANRKNKKLIKKVILGAWILLFVQRKSSNMFNLIQIPFQVGTWNRFVRRDLSSGFFVKLKFVQRNVW